MATAGYKMHTTAQLVLWPGLAQPWLSARAYNCAPMALQASQADLHAHLPKITRLRELQAPSELTAATLAALAPLTALTKLHLVRARSGHAVSMQAVGSCHECRLLIVAESVYAA